MNWNKTLPLAIIILFLMVDFLTFHDFFETHTVKDWLILAVSIFTFIYFAKVSYKKIK